MDRIALLAWLALGVIWGSNFIFMKWATDYISPLQVVLARVLFGFLPVLIYALANRQLKLSDLRFAGHFVAMACLAAVVYYYGFAHGTSLLPSGIAGAVSGSIPLFSMIAAVTLLPDERLSRYRVLGLLGTGLAYILYYFIVERLGAVGASTVTYLPPVVALLIGSVFVGERIELLDILAAGFILGGVFLTSRR